MRIRARVNGRETEIDAPRAAPLLGVLRDELGLFGARFGCGRGQCGACTVLLDGRPVASCTLTLDAAAGRDLRTIEGLAPMAEGLAPQGGPEGALHPLQEAFVAEDALQCGFCTSGILLSAAALLERSPSPTEEEVREALAGHLCRCGIYGRIVRAVLRAAAPPQGTR